MTVIDPIEEIARAQATELVREDGEPTALTVEPGLQADEIEALEQRVGVALPNELRVLLGHTAGIGGVLESIDFTGAVGGFEVPEIFPSGVSIAADGFGNSWVLDLTPAERAAARVFFACHDAPVILYQSASIGHFLHEVFGRYLPPHTSLIDDVQEDRLFDVWRQNAGVMTVAAARASGDHAVAAFAATLEDDFELVDFRTATIGMGFSWGRYGPHTEVRRHQHERLFAYRRPPGRRQVLQRLFKSRDRAA